MTKLKCRICAKCRERIGKPADRMTQELQRQVDKQSGLGVND